jgi:hypothetical protein
MIDNSWLRKDSNDVRIHIQILSSDSIEERHSTYVYNRGHVIGHMMRELDDQPDKAIVYYFFDSPRKDSLSTIHFMRSVLHQLLDIKSMTLTAQYRLEAIIGVDGEREPDFDELFELIFEMCGNRSQVFFIIDGIDETELEEQRAIFRLS